MHPMLLLASLVAAKQQYVPRLLSYIEAKKTRAKRRYDTSIAKVRDFNATLASILPHFLYFSLCFLLWRIARPIISWLADDTYATPFLSTFYPVFGTMAVLQRRALLVSGGEAQEIAKRRFMKQPPG